MDERAWQGMAAELNRRRLILQARMMPLCGSGTYREVSVPCTAGPGAHQSDATTDATNYT